ncbi:MAG: winged helix-turn-helix domain-containing protein [Nitrospirae bacterium]|nr:winged helix-turn-helix domain-containing protein [Nitrospirota bacterium]
MTSQTVAETLGINVSRGQLRLDFALWTREAVRLLIKQEDGLDMPIRTVGLHLKRWGFTPRKPLIKGDGCQSHMDAIKEHGACAIHRKSFRGVKPE